MIASIVNEFTNNSAVVNPRPARRWIRFTLIFLLIAVIGLELFARFQLGLGDPPLMMRDEQTEYRAQPSRSYNRFGNRIAYNQWSMRSDDFPQRKTDPREFRVLVMGDSVVNGGVLIDQNKIATELIRSELAAVLNRSVVVGNIAAGSWGPPNLLAYVKKFGLFDADAVVIVLSSHDATDAPTFEPLGVDAPDRKPLLALQEAIQRYLPRYVPRWLSGAKSDLPRTDDQEAADREQSIAALRELLHLVQDSGARLLVVQHAEASELQAGPQPGHADFRSVAVALNIEMADLGPAFGASLSAGKNPYRDTIHPNDIGQRIIADAILEWIVSE